MLLVLEALRVDLVYVFRSGGSSRNPAAGGHDFQPAYRGIVSRSAGELGENGFVTQVRFLDGLGRQLQQLRFLLGCGRSVNSCVVRRTELRLQFAIVFSGVLAAAGGDLRRQQVHDQAIFVGSPNGSIAPQEARACAFLAAKAVRAVD